VQSGDAATAILNVAELKSEAAVTRGYKLDVGLEPVIELNPTWSCKRFNGVPQ
jgi:hypothetical protein